MFKFDGCIDRGTFLRSAALRIALFIASIVAFPFLLVSVASLSGCARVGGACGAVGLVASMAFKPLAFILFVFSLMGISVRRTRDAGMPGALGLFIPLLFAANYTFFVYAGAPWTFAFSSGVLFQTFPRAALLGLYCIAILCVLPSRYRDENANPFGAAGLVAFALMLLIAANATLLLAITFAGVQPWTLQLSPILRSIGWIIPYAMIALAAALAWIGWQYREPQDYVAESTAPVRAAAFYPAVPVGWLLLFALVPTLFVCVIVIGKDVPLDVPTALIVNLSSMVLPTLALYFFPILGAWLVATRRTPVSFAMLGLALLPFLHWGYANWTANQDHQREAAEIAAIPTKPAPRVPATIVFESPHTEGMRGVWKVPAIERTIAKGAYGRELAQFERNARANNARQTSVPALPDEYLLLKVGRSSSFAKQRQIYSAAGGPFELRFVDSSHDDLIAIWYQTFNPAPAALPLLTTSGWYRGPNSVSVGDIDVRVSQFLATALKVPG
jgi:uncharacterized membrane protein YhaH (DUF805 family)